MPTASHSILDVEQLNNWHLISSWHSSSSSRSRWWGSWSCSFFTWADCGPSSAEVQHRIQHNNNGVLLPIVAVSCQKSICCGSSRFSVLFTPSFRIYRIFFFHSFKKNTRAEVVRDYDLVPRFSPGFSFTLMNAQQHSDRQRHSQR